MNGAPATTATATEPTRCVLCQGESRRLFAAAGYWIRQCDSCAHQFAEVAPHEGHVQAVYGDDYFSRGGAGYNGYFDEQPVLVERGKWYARRIARLCPPGAMLDVGAAAGFTLRGFAAEGWQVQGIEPNAQMADYANKQLQIPVEAASLETWRSDRSFDLVTMLQVLPHFVNPRLAVTRAAELVRPGGHLLIETWDRNSWTARLFGKNWHEYSPPSVLHWFSKAGLVRLMADAGFAPMDQGRPFKWISVGHAKSLLRHKTDVSLTNRLALGITRLAPDRWQLPYPGDDLVWMLFRRCGAASDSPLAGPGFAITAKA